VLGSWWKRLPPGEDPDAVFGEGAIGYAARAGTREAMALLRALTVLGVTPEQRNAAATAATALTAAGVADPPLAATRRSGCRSHRSAHQSLRRLRHSLCQALGTEVCLEVL
jgi:hypothetical protein